MNFPTPAAWAWRPRRLLALLGVSCLSWGAQAQAPELPVPDATAPLLALLQDPSVRTQAGQTAPGQNGQNGQTTPPDQPDASTYQVEQRRQLIRSYAVPAAGRAFSLDTRYGRVQIVPWNKTEIRVEAELVARAETVVGARQLLDALGVQFLDYDARTGGVAVSSQFGPALRGRSGGGCRYEVNYTISLPRTTALRVAAAFAEVSVAGDLRGATDLAVDYGNLRTGRLEGLPSTVRISNGDCSIAYARQATLEARFARLQLEAGRVVELRNHYSDITMGSVRDLTVHSKYGDVALGTVHNLHGSSGYTRFSIDRLSEVLDMDLRYCPDFEVRDFGPNFRQVNLDGGHSTIRLGFAETAGFRFDVRTEQGQLLVDPRQVRVLSEETGPQRSDVLGVFGGAVPVRSVSNVNINVRYGTVRFIK